MEINPDNACTGDSNIADESLDVVSRFVNLLGSSARQLSLEDNEKELVDCLSLSLMDDDIVCSLPSFRVDREMEEKTLQQQNTKTLPWKSFQSVQETIQSSMWSVLHQTKEEEAISNKYQSSQEFTRSTVSLAPLTLLRSLQDNFQDHCRCRLNEWKELLKKHQSREAEKLVGLLSYQKIIVGCRGNTKMNILSSFEEEEYFNGDTASDSSIGTEESSVNTQMPSLPCKLQVEFFIKLRHSPRSFTTSRFTLNFETLGCVRYCRNSDDGKLTHLSFECDESEIMQQIETKANALVHKAVTSYAMESVRWSRTFLSDLWDSEGMGRDEESCSDNSLSTMSTFASYLNTFHNNRINLGTYPSGGPEGWKKGRHSLSRFSVPEDIITTEKSVKESQKEDKQCGFENAKGWQQSCFYQITAFLFLLLLSVQFMMMKEFCGSLFRRHNKTDLISLTMVRPLLSGTEIDQSSPKGVSFHRIISTFPDDGSFLLELNDADSNCQVTDKFGVNFCHVNWKDQVFGNFSTRIGQVLDESSTIEADVMVEGHIPYKIQCALCGQPCEIRLPLINFKYSFHMPPCPVDLRDHFQDFQYQLWSHSPTEGLVSMSLDASVVVYSSPDEKLAEFEVLGTIR